MFIIVLPLILNNPSDVTILTGKLLRLMFRASGIDVKYQWLRNGKLLPGATFNVLRFIKINESNEGIYKCVVSNKGGEVEFNPATVTVYGK